MAINFSIPNINEPVFDRSTGLMDEGWYRFFEDFERQTHATTSDVSGVGTDITGIKTRLEHDENDIRVLKEDTAQAKTFGFAWDRPVASFPAAGGPIRYVDAGIPWTIQSIPDGGGHRAYIDANGTAPTAATTFTIKVAGVTVGSFTFAIGQMKAVFTIANDYAVGNDDVVTIEAPGALNGITGTLYGTILGVR